MQSCKKHQRQGKIVLFDDKSKKADRILLFMNEAIHKDESLMLVSVKKKESANEIPVKYPKKLADERSNQHSQYLLELRR